jgi:5-methylcytosine-specific restriction protein A
MVTAAEEVDHIKPLWRGGRNEWANYQGLCVPCHLEKTAEDKAIAKAAPLSPEAKARHIPAVQKPAIPVTIVCGPPGSGKTTYVAERAGLRDVVIDLDVIMSRLSGQPIHQVSSRWIGMALTERNRILAGLAKDAVHERAWFILTGSDPVELRIWQEMLDATVITLDVSLEECIRRITADADRAGQTKRMIEAVRQWWLPRGGV